MDTGVGVVDNSAPTKILETEATDTPFPANTAVPTAPVEPTDTAEPTETPTMAPTPFPEVDLNIELPEGDPLRGLNAAVRYRCFGCHTESPNYGPPFASEDGLSFILERGELRIADPAFKGRAETNMEYVIESIFLPEIYTIPGEWEEAMPTTFLARMSDQELANIVAWIKSLESN